MNETKKNKIITLDDILKESLKRRSFIVSASSLIAGGLICPSPAFSAHINEIKTVRLGKKKNGARFVAELKGDVNYTVFMLHDPYRIVIDLPKTSKIKNKQAFETSNNLIKDVRFGKLKDDNLRLVLDLKNPAIVKKVFILKPQSNFGYRLVVDLQNTNHDEFMGHVGISKAIAKNKKISNQLYSKNSSQKTSPNITKKEKKIIILDPGHGGRDPGAIGYSGVYEKNITLSMGHELKKRLENTGRYDVRLTRNKDTSVALRSRVARARKYDGDLFISLHADSNRNKSVRGLSVYTLSERSSDAEAAALAERENKADIIAGLDLNNEPPEVAGILIDLAQRETMNLSAEFANIMVKEMVKRVKLLRNTHRFAGFAVLKAPDIPSVLLEMGYLSNKYEERKLRKKSYRAKLAQATTESIDNFFEQS